MNKNMKKATLLFAVFLVFVIGIALATPNIEWTWTGKVEEVVIEHYEDQACTITHPGIYDSPSATNGETYTTYVKNKGTVDVILSITIVNTGNTWITTTHDYLGTTILIGESVTIVWTLSITTEHSGETFTLSITIIPTKV